MSLGAILALLSGCLISKQHCDLDSLICSFNNVNLLLNGLCGLLEMCKIWYIFSLFFPFCSPDKCPNAPVANGEIDYLQFLYSFYWILSLTQKHLLFVHFSLSRYNLGAPRNRQNSRCAVCCRWHCCTTLLSSHNNHHL